MTKTRERLGSILEVCGWGLIGPTVISGVYLISKVLFPQSLGEVLIIAVLGSLFAAIVALGSSDIASAKALAYTAGLLFWIFVSIYLVVQLIPISVSKTTLLIACVVYGLILINRLRTSTPQQSDE